MSDQSDSANESQSTESEDSEVVSQGKYGDTQINPDELGNSYEQVGDDLKAKVHPNGRLYLRVRDSDDGRRWNEFSVPLGGGGDGE